MYLSTYVVYCFKWFTVLKWFPEMRKLRKPMVGCKMMYGTGVHRATGNSAIMSWQIDTLASLLAAAVTPRKNINIGPQDGRPLLGGY